MQDVIKELYPKIKNSDIIKAKKYGRYAKTDIVVSVRNKQKGISLKCGYKNSVHVEPINKFTKFLISQGINEEFIDILVRYLYSDGTNNNTGLNRISSDEYISYNHDNINKLNIVLNKYKSKLIKRFLVKTDINYKVEPNIFIHGFINDFIWVTADEVKSYLENEKNDSGSVHISKLYIQSWDKNIKRNPTYEYCREYIQVKWFSMYDDMISIMANRNIVN